MASLTRSPLDDDHVSRGAVLGEYHGAVVPARFSDPRAEHQAVRQAAGVFDFSFRSKFAVQGADHVTFLHNMLSNDVKGLSSGQGTYAALLNVKGHLVADLRLYRDPDRITVDTDADLREKTIQTLDRYIIMDDVALARLELFSIVIQGRQSRALLEAALKVDLPALGEFCHFEAFSFGSWVRIVRASSTGEEGYEIWTGAEGLAGVWHAVLGETPRFDALPCGIEALESLRIEAGIPRYGSELGEDTLPLEAGLLNALSFNKGCYVGQEVVERSRSRGHVNWKLVGLMLEAADSNKQVCAAAPPASGEKLLAKGKELGEVTSACFSPTLGRSIALAYVRREVAGPGTKLTLASGPSVEVVQLPFYGRQSES